MRTSDIGKAIKAWEYYQFLGRKVVESCGKRNAALQVYRGPEKALVVYKNRCVALDHYPKRKKSALQIYAKQSIYKERNAYSNKKKYREENNDNECDFMELLRGLAMAIIGGYGSRRYILLKLKMLDKKVEGLESEFTKHKKDLEAQKEAVKNQKQEVQTLKDALDEQKKAVEQQKQELQTLKRALEGEDKWKPWLICGTCAGFISLGTIIVLWVLKDDP